MFHEQLGSAVEVTGSIYPPSPLYYGLSQFCSYLFILGLLLLFAGEYIFNTLNLPFGLRIVNYLKLNQTQVMIGLFALNWLSGQLVSTGAFEVSYNGRTVFSKLTSGELPNPTNLLHRAHDMIKRIENPLSHLPPNSY